MKPWTRLKRDRRSTNATYCDGSMRLCTPADAAARDLEQARSRVPRPGL